MFFILKLRKLAMNFLNKKNLLLNYDIELQKKYLTTLGEPSDDIERSFFQYCCQMKLYGYKYKMVVNAVSPILILTYIIRNYTKKQGDQPKESVLPTAIFFTNSLTNNYLPIELTEGLNIKNVELSDQSRLTRDDMKFYWSIVLRYPFSWFYQFKILMKIGVYSEQIEKYRPEAVIVSAEYSFTSSVMTYYCNKKNIQHINIQHGEKVFFMEDAFFRFNKCYLWDSLYIRILVDLMAEASQFQISVPPILTEIKHKIELFKQNNTNRVDCTYYLAGEKKSELMRIKNTLLPLVDSGKCICIRPHPRYGNDESLEGIFHRGFIIEDTQKVSIEDSLSRCNLAISLWSTVLLQAYFGGVESAIDDISFPEHYQQLERTQFVMLKKSKRLSEIIRGEASNNEQDIDSRERWIYRK